MILRKGAEHGPGARGRPGRDPQGSRLGFRLPPSRNWGNSRPAPGPVRPQGRDHCPPEAPGAPLPPPSSLSPHLYPQPAGQHRGLSAPQGRPPGEGRPTASAPLPTPLVSPGRHPRETSQPLPPQTEGAPLPAQLSLAPWLLGRPSALCCFLLLFSR